MHLLLIGKNDATLKHLYGQFYFELGKCDISEEHFYGMDG